MRLHRFYINKNIEIGKEIRIDDSEFLNQWGRVFRLKSGDKIILFNGNGFEYEAHFKILSKKEAVLIIDKENDPCLSASSPHESASPEVHLFQSVIKKDNFELIVQKCTEIGVSAFHPIISERSEKKDLNIERLVKIAKEASEQSGKVKLPKIFEPESLEKAIENFSGELFVLDFDGEPFSSLSFLRRQESILASSTAPASECHNHPVSQTQHPSSTEAGIQSKRIAALVGPEGGWSDKEREFFKQKGIKSVSLGKQVLRAETAAIAVSAIILLK
ncbi:MAG: 16S rRNA (uracil(1498)-N(3))-methyltransferase [Candidatus Taylorbacteria bacterium]|nr:16S rRNA (uracil(1498)-N(3))-methyltransferase [Candidatus Taylorbacteria bacterium]